MWGEQSKAIPVVLWMWSEVGILERSAGVWGAKGETLSLQSSGAKGVLMFSLRFAVPIPFPVGSLWAITRLPSNNDPGTG